MKTRILAAIIIVGMLLSYTNVLLACPRPTAILHGSPPQTFVGNTVHLDGSGSYSYPWYPITKYKWNFDYVNDPNTWVESSSIITHSYNTPGTYTVALKVVHTMNVESLITEQSKFTVDVNGVIYVNGASPAGDDGNGFTWATAFNHLQSALDNANSGVQIWVAQGTYIPSKRTISGNSRTATFKLANGVSLYGGFNGTETSLNQRDWQAYPTVLSGDLAGDDVGDLTDSSRSENAYHVVTGSDTNAAAVLDGFAVTAGNANGNDPCYRGGGMYNSSGSPTVNNCGFSYNNATYYGGGVYNNRGEPNFSNCTFGYNSASYGGGVDNNNGEPNFINCTFTNEGYSSGVYNSGGEGTFAGCVFSDHVEVAIYNANGASPLIKNCVFTSNSNYSYGGAIYNDYNNGSYSPQIINCIFAGNSASDGGGAIYLSMNCHAAITNCVFNNNSTDYYGDGGGAIYNDGGEPNFYNCIFWGDNAPTGGEIYNNNYGYYSYGTIRFRYCDVEGGLPNGTKVHNSDYCTIDSDGSDINADPRFADVCNPAGLDGILFTDDDGLQLEPNSPCIDTCPASGAPDKDILGRTRVNIPFVGSDSNTYSVDMGAYEVQRPVWHVKQGSTGSNNGIGWNNAFNYLQDALTAARTYGGDIWVAAGTYKPDQNSTNPNGTGSRYANFALINGVGLYGGFAGSETICSRRDPVRNETILSGNIGGSGINDSYNVVVDINVGQTAVLSGFTVADGNANGGSSYSYGGGMYDYNASPTIMDCNFRSNKAYYYGGAICNGSNSNPVITRCFFLNNEANTSGLSCGGAIFNSQSSPKLNDCIFINNIARRGGGAICNSQSSPTLLNCIFSGNISILPPGTGGAVYNTGSSPVMTNCVFSANLARIGGGIYNYSSSSPTLINCTFNRNSATATYGGGMYNYSSCSPVVTNCIFWNNTAVSGGNEIYNYSATPTFSHCDIKGCLAGGSWNSVLGTDGGGNIDIDPNFVDANNPAGPDGILGTSDDGLQLQIFDLNLPSCIDAADGNAAPATDICGHGRIDIDYVPNTGSGDPNYADIGAYEYDDTPGYTTSLEQYQGYGNVTSVGGVDGWKVENGSDTLHPGSYANNSYQYDQIWSDSKISYEATQPRDESTVRISCIPSPGSYINVLSGPATIASIKFGKSGNSNIYVWDNGAYKVSSAQNYAAIVAQCTSSLNGQQDPCSSWIEFTIEFDWVNHLYDVSWTNYAFPNGAVIYSGASFYSGCNSYTKVEFVTSAEDNTSFNLNSMSFSDEETSGGVIGPDNDIWIISPQADMSDPLKGRCAIVGKMWYDKLGQYIIKACSTDLDPNDANNWRQICWGMTVSKDPTTLGYWNTASFYNGDYFLKVEVYDDIGRLYTQGIITEERTFNNGQSRVCNVRYPIIGRRKPQTYTYQELPDFKINWPGSFPFEFQRTYNSGQSSRLCPLFYGWTHNHNIRLIEDTSFDWITDANDKPVRDGKGLGIGRLWLLLPSGGGLFIGHVDDTNANNVIYEPTDKTNQHIVRTVNYIHNPTTTPDINVTYVYYAPDSRKMTFNKEFTVGFPVPSLEVNEGLINWMVIKGVDKQEDRFGNALLYTWESSETFLQQISNNRTPAKLVFVPGLGGCQYLCSAVQLYPNSNDGSELYDLYDGCINFSCYVYPGAPTASYSTWRQDRQGMDDTANYTYTGGPEFKLTEITPNGTYVKLNRYAIYVKYNEDGSLSEKQNLYHYYGGRWGESPYQPIERYSYEYDDKCNLVTTVEVNSTDDIPSITLLRKEVSVTTPEGATLRKSTGTFRVRVNDNEFDPYFNDLFAPLGDGPFWVPPPCQAILDMGYHAGGGGATDVNYYYADSNFPLKPTMLITYFSDNGNGVYNRPSQKTTLAYDCRGNVTTQKVYVDDVNYVLTTYDYHNTYDFPVCKTTWKVYRYDGDSNSAVSSYKVEKQWLYGDVNGTLINNGKDGNYLAVQGTLLDNSTGQEQWADVCSTYYPGGQIRQKTDPEGGISYYQYDVNGFECNEWQGATLAGGLPIGNPQKRYYYDGLGQKILEADCFGRVEMDVYLSNGLLAQSRQYIDPTAVSRSDFRPDSYDTDIPDDFYNLDSSVDWWTNRTLYNCYYVDKPQNTTLATGGPVGSNYFRAGNNGVYTASSYLTEFDTVLTDIAADDGRPLDEIRVSYFATDSGESDARIISIYDSMRRLIHKYSYTGSIYCDTELCYADYYVKHEEYQYDASGNKIFEASYWSEGKNDGSHDWRPEKANSYEYDILNRLTKEIVDSNATAGMKLTTKYGYDALGNRIYVIAPDGNVVLTDYDNANRKLCEYFATTPVYYPGTDKVNVVATRNNATARTEVTYYKNDKVKDSNSYDYGTGLLARSEYSYDSRGRINEVNEFITTSDIATTRYDYNDAGFALSDPCGYKYQIKITDANNKNTWISMHPLGKPQKIVYPSGDYEECVYYNLALADPNSEWNGLLGYEAVWDASGNKQYIKYEYDEYGKVSRIIYPDGGYLAYKYKMRDTKDFGRVRQIEDYRDTNDRPGSDVNDHGIYTFDYWYLTGKIKSYTDNDGYEVNYMYSFAYDQPTHIDVNAPNYGGVIYEVNYVYDMAGRFVDVCEPLLGDNQNLIAGFDYDKNGNRAHLYYSRDGTGTPPTTVSVGYTYNRDNMLAGFTTSGGPVFSFDASQSGDLDGLGRLRVASETLTNTGQTQIARILANGYNMRSQLTSSSMTNVGSYDVCDGYSYEKAGNVESHTYTTSSPSSSTTSFCFNGDLMTKINSVNVGWDKNGDMNYYSSLSKSFVYNWDKKLRSATKVAPPYSIQIKYDPMGNRVWKYSKYNNSIITCRKYVVDVAGGLPTILLEIDPCTGSLAKTYIWANGEILAQHNGDYTANRYFYLHDRLGSVREVIDQNTTVVRYYTYDPFGKTREGTADSLYPFMFTGQYYDYEISQYYLRARQYDPVLMRFTSRDPISGKFKEPATLHKYLYCMNNSINKIDPSGKQPDEYDWGVLDGTFEEMLNVYNNMEDLPIPEINTSEEMGIAVSLAILDTVLPEFADAVDIIRFSTQATPYLQRIAYMNALETAMIFALAADYGD